MIYLVYALEDGRWELVGVKSGRRAAGREVRDLKAYGYEHFKIMECEERTYLVPRNVEIVKPTTNAT